MPTEALCAQVHAAAKSTRSNMTGTKRRSSTMVATMRSVACVPTTFHQTSRPVLGQRKRSRYLGLYCLLQLGKLAPTARDFLDERVRLHGSRVLPERNQGYILMREKPGLLVVAVAVLVDPKRRDDCPRTRRLVEAWLLQSRGLEQGLLP